MLEEISEFVEKALSIDLLHLGLQLCSTLILFVVVRAFLWKPITNILEQRRELAMKEISDAKQKNDEATKLLDESRKEVEKAKKRAKEIVDNAVITAKLEKSEIIEDAKNEAKKRLDNVNHEIGLELERQKNTLRQEIVDVAFLAAEKIVKREINKEEHIKVVEETLEEVGK
jgi:F-type H+-transporting ATPase subunit b